MRHSITLLVVLMQVAAVSAAADMETMTLFRSGDDGYHTYRIPSLLVTKTGTLLAFCEGRKEGRGDSGNIDLLVKRSGDGGQTWSDQQIVWDDGPNTCGNPCPVVDQRTGRIVLAVTWNRGDDHGADLKRGTAKDTRRPYLLTSDDDGRTWTDPREITDAVKKPTWLWYATGPGVSIQLRHGPHAGRLVVPACHSTNEYDPGQGRSASHAMLSDDGGKTWRLSNNITPRCSESQLVELADGTLMMNMRSPSFSAERTGYRKVAFSRDGGQTWSAPGFDESLGGAICQGSVLFCESASEDDHDRLLFSNPASPVGMKRNERIRMTVRLSLDNGKTWAVSKLIHAGPSAYSCLARLPDGRIGLLYEAGESRLYERIELAKFTLDWLTRTR